MKKLISHVIYILCFFQITSIHAITGLKQRDETYKKHTGLISVGNQSFSYRYPAIYFQNESMLYRNILSLNKELGFNFSYYHHPFLSQTKIFKSYSNIAVESRWYYSKQKRRNIDIDSPVRFSPFLSLKFNAVLPLGLSYYSYPDYNKAYYSYRILPNRLDVIIPRWGAQGNIKDLFYYEFGLGIVYFHEFNADAFTQQMRMTKGFLPDFFLRVGVRIY